MTDADVDGAVVGLARREAAKHTILDDIEACERLSALAGQGKRAAWVGTGNPLSCAKWEIRRQQLEALATRVTAIGGLNP